MRLSKLYLPLAYPMSSLWASLVPVPSGVLPPSNSTRASMRSAPLPVLARSMVTHRTVPGGDVAAVTVAPAGVATRAAAIGVTVTRSATVTEASPATGASIT